MIVNNDAGMIPGLSGMDGSTTKAGEPGPVEVGTDKALQTLRNGGWLTDAHAHLEALARATAQKFDRIPEREKAYGYAQVTQALTKVFELLPTPDAGADRKWEEFMSALENAGDDGIGR